jgi:predicted nucleotidyltransferase
MNKTPQEIAKIIQEMVRRIVQTVNPTKIILFGSHARGTAGPDSDVDLLVIMAVSGSKRKKAVEIHRILAGVGLPKDVIVATPEDIAMDRDIPGTLIRPALMEGKVLYERAA